PKLWPKFSPNKTWSGFVGGLAGAVVAAIAVAVLSRLKISIGAAAAVGLVGGLATMTGDLWESILKRRYGVKDSGDLIPGHGGLLDRVDGLMFAAVIVAGARLIAFIGFPF
ncbi:MAG: CDP-archaeol synthase, partial [Caulobacteraceae bacterium]|nr:CDP-archaeol synthase [Caulobacteraceae bacterium]